MHTLFLSFLFRFWVFDKQKFFMTKIIYLDGWVVDCFYLDGWVVDCFYLDGWVVDC